MTATRAWSMVEEAPGVVWVGQVGEVSRVERDSVTRRFQELDGIPPGPIRVLLPGREGGLWIAAYGGGLAHAGRDGRVRSLAGADSLFDHSLSGVVRDHVGRLWIMGDRGVGVAHERELAAALDGGRAPHDMVVLGPADSMPEGNGGFPNAWIDDTHRLWLATIDGVASVDAGGLMQGLPPEPRIDAVRVDGTAISWRDTVAVPAGRRSLEVDFAAPDLDGRQRLRLRYRLLGHDHGWVEAGEGRTAAYARVAPGRYTFEVRIANASGAQGRNPASLVVRVQAAWWQSTWLRLLAAALLLYGTWYWGRAGMARLQARNMALQHEIAERVRAQEAAERAAAELAHAARLATAGELSASVAHELNQPLAAILSNAQAAHAMLVHGPTNELPPTIDDIVRQARRAADVVRSMRVFARKQAPELRTVDLGEVVEEALTLIRCELKSRGVEARVSREPSAGPVEGDAVQLQQVVVNLALNAADAVRELPAERRLVDIGITAADGVVHLDVCDAGPGLAPEALASLFQPFYTTKPTGLGLGLSLSRTIVETHGGTLLVQSRPGEGTVVRCTFPVVRP